MLALTSVTAGYGAFTALWDVSLRVEPGEAVAVVGPNGAGKTTLMRVISGLIAPRVGTLTFEGAAIGGRPAYEIVGRGIAHVPEGRRIFPALSVGDNLKMGAFLPAARKTFAESLARGPLYAALTPSFSLLRVDQRWDMFAPYPSKEDGWFVIPASLSDGSELRARACPSAGPS